MKRKRSESSVDKEEEKVEKKKKSNVLKKVKERQRRSKISESIAELKKLVPSCQQHKKLNQSLIMSMSVDYIRFLQKKVARLEAENGLLKKGIPVDENSLPYVPETPESTFTEYQKKKDNDADFDQEMSDQLDESMSSNLEYIAKEPNHNRVLNHEKDVHQMPMKYDVFKWENEVVEQQGYPNVANTLGGMLSQIPTMYMNGESRENGMTNMVPNGMPPMNIDPQVLNGQFPTLEQRDNIGLPLFRENNKNYRSKNGVPPDPKKSNLNQTGQQFNMEFPTMGDIEDFGAWPLHFNVQKQNQPEQSNEPFIPTLPQFREYN